MPQFALMVLVAAAIACGGCATTTPSPRNLIAIAVTTMDGKAPSQEQLTRILTAMRPELARAGFQFAPTTDQADFIVSVKFTADANGSGGRVSVIAVEPNLRSVAAASGENEAAKEMRRRLQEIEAWSRRELTRTDL